MSDNSINDSLNEEETLKGIITDTVTGICGNNSAVYSNICRFASRSEGDKLKIVTDVFELMTKDTLPCTLQGALSQVDNSLNGWGGDDK